MARRNSAFTMLEMFCIIVVVAIITLFMIPAVARRSARASRIRCVNNLKNVGLSHRIFAVDHNDLFVFQISITNGGALELTNDIVVQYQILSNELSTPKNLICPDRVPQTRPASNFATLTKSNINFYIGLTSSETNPQSILGGETGFTINGKPHDSCLRDVASNAVIAYPKLHSNGALPGVLSGDGSVHVVAPNRWTEILTATGVPTNRFLFP